MKRLVAAGLLLVPATASAQGYRVALDMRVQTVAWRGWQIDSIIASEAVVGPGGGLETPDGFAVDCTSALAYCWYYRGGPELTAAPAVFTTDITAWGLGIKGLSARGDFRLHYNLGEPGWPGQQPTLQLWEGYLDYQRDWLQARAGRQVITGRLGWLGFDGGRVTLRSQDIGLEISGYAGWGLARASAVPVNDPITAPLGDFIPPRRSVVGGAIASWRSSSVDLRAEYLREVEEWAKKYAAHQVALSGTVRMTQRWQVTGGAEYDIAQGLLGSADLSLRYSSAQVTASGGYRRYRPTFPLWTVWPAFSPVPYNSALASAWVQPDTWLQLRGRVEYYRFEDSETQTPLFPTVQDGWRWSAGARVTPWARWAFDAGTTWERGTGGGILGYDAAVRYDVRNNLTLNAMAEYMKRPLAYRYDDAILFMIGGEAVWRVTPSWNVSVAATWLDEDRERPDASGFDWTQTRLSARVSYAFSSSDASPRAVPAVIERMPSMTGMGR